MVAINLLAPNLHFSRFFVNSYELLTTVQFLVSSIVCCIVPPVKRLEGGWRCWGGVGQATNV